MRRVTALVVLVFALLSCSQKSELAGEITMRPGDVKPGADVEVVLIDRTKFDQPWGDLVTQFKDDYHSARQELESASARSSAQTKVAEATLNLWAINPANPDYRARKDAEFQELNKAGERVSDSMRRLSSILTDYQRRGLKLIREHQMASAKTDSNGEYKLVTQSQGKRYLYAHHRTSDRYFYWFVEVNLQPRTQRLDLTERNAGWPLSPKDS